MPTIFEIFGRPLRFYNQPENQESVYRTIKCPFMDSDCDGGGNRYLSKIKLTQQDSQLKGLFGERNEIPLAVCSIQLTPNQSPWIVCPRRLLFLGKQNVIGHALHQGNVMKKVIELLGYSNNTKLGIWPEVKLMYEEKPDNENTKIFNYTFDYIIMPIGNVNISGMNKQKLIKAGYEISKCKSYVEDYPLSENNPSIVEIMTSSTSGGNQNKETTIQNAFKTALLNTATHKSPSINKRQVWARMVSQLIAKSEVGVHWGGKTLWLVQNHLVEYISQTTGLDLDNLASNNPSDVNILSFSYPPNYADAEDIIDLEFKTLYVGQIPPLDSNAKDFRDIIRAPVKPGKELLLSRLAQSSPVIKIDP